MPAAMAGRASGSTMRQKIRVEPAPSVRDASSMFAAWVAKSARTGR